MGRVAKYKKIKACDPYSKKNGGKIDLAAVGIWGLGDNGRKPKKRSRRAEVLRANKKKKREQDNGFDLPPNEKQDEFDMKDLVGSVKRQKLINPMKEMSSDKDSLKVDLVPVNGNVATIPKTDEDEKKLARILQVKTQVKREVEKKDSQKHARMEGESKNAYNKRTKAETRQIIKQTTTEKRNPEKKLKKKEFLANKKKKKKGSTAPGGEVGGNQADESDNDVLITGERAIALVDEVKFGEQAERPPTFRQLPRGAKKKEDGLKNKTAEKKSKGMTQEDVEAENKAMDLMRRKIQAQYAAIKVKRRMAGDFHL